MEVSSNSLFQLENGVLLATFFVMKWTRYSLKNNSKFLKSNHLVAFSDKIYKLCPEVAVFNLSYFDKKQIFFEKQSHALAGAFIG